MKRINLMVIGGLGQLGRAIHDYIESEEIKTDLIECNYIDINDSETYFWVEKLDALDDELLLKYINENDINYIVNCAAYTNVDKAEEDIDCAYNLNVELPKKLAIICDKLSIPFVHISTDYVYGGLKNTPYEEDDLDYILPNSMYGTTKRKGEIAVQRNCNDYIIIRTSWLYYTGENSFPAKITRNLNCEYQMPARVVMDQIGSPTYAINLAKAILDIISNNRNGFNIYDNQSQTNNRVGIYNYSDDGVCSWFDFAHKIEELIYPCKEHYTLIVPCKTSDFKTKAKRPHYSVMDKSKIMKNFPYISFNWWNWGIEDFINKQKLQEPKYYEV